MLGRKKSTHHFFFAALSFSCIRLAPPFSKPPPTLFFSSDSLYFSRAPFVGIQGGDSRPLPTWFAPLITHGRLVPAFWPGSVVRPRAFTSFCFWPAFYTRQRGWTSQGGFVASIEFFFFVAPYSYITSLFYVLFFRRLLVLGNFFLREP